MKLINKEVLMDWVRVCQAKSKAEIPQLSINKILKHLERMDCIEIPMTQTTYRGKHEVKR